MLQRRRRDKGDKLMHTLEFHHQSRRCHTIAGLPAGHVKRFAKRKNRVTARRETRFTQHAPVWLAVVDQMFINLIRHHDQVMLLGYLQQRVQIILIDHAARRIMRRVDHDHACAWRNRTPHRCPVDTISRGREREMHGHTTGQAHGRVVTVINRVKHDDFITRSHHGVHRAENGFGCTRRNGDLGIGIDRMVVKTRDLGGDLLAQGRHTGQRRVLVVTVGGVVGQPLRQRRRAIVIGITLGKINRLMIVRHLRHDGENRRADIRQFAFETRRGAHEGLLLLMDNARHIRRPRERTSFAGSGSLINRAPSAQTKAITCYG